MNAPFRQTVDRARMKIKLPNVILSGNLESDKMGSSKDVVKKIDTL